jgi:hypothetical protein
MDAFECHSAELGNDALLHQQPMELVTHPLSDALVQGGSYRTNIYDHYHHSLNGSASNVVRTGRSVNGSRPKLTSHRSATSWLIKTKLSTIHYVRGIPHRPKLIISRSTGPAHKGSTYKLSVDFFLCCSFLVTAPSKKRLSRY